MTCQPVSLGGPFIVVRFERAQTRDALWYRPTTLLSALCESNYQLGVPIGAIVAITEPHCHISTRTMSHRPPDANLQILTPNQPFERAGESEDWIALNYALAD